MATFASRFLLHRCGQVILCRQFAKHAEQVNSRAAGSFKALGFTVSVASLVGYMTYRAVNGKSLLSTESVKVFAKSDDVSEEASSESTKDAIQIQREKRFLDFASVEYDGNVYMTPVDFLESILLETARARTSRRHLRQNDVDKFLSNTPSKRKGSSFLFRDIYDQGLVSYTEYLFLLCILTKPSSGFRIAFNMFDVDVDQKVDKKEFLVMVKIYKKHVLKESDICTTEAVCDKNIRSNIRTNIWNLLLHEKKSSEEKSNDAVNDTTLTVHFFGQKGKDVLKYEDFYRFMNDLQTEVLDLEFKKYSQGMQRISEEDFATVLLRYTVLTSDEREEYLERLRRRVLNAKGISFKDFKEFFQFINSIDDFALAMKFNTVADLPVSEGDFKRAVKACTGQMLDDHLVNVVFKLFDKDGDGKLSHNEFLSVMKDRLYRGAKVTGDGYWETYRTCVKNEMKSS